jgi:hypothetical protein
VVEVVNKLNNSGDGVRLFNAQHVLQDYFAFASSSAGLSYGRMPNGTGGWQLLQTPSSGSANIANPTPIPTPTPTPLPTATPSGSSSSASPTPALTPSATLDPTLQPPQLSEIMACPASDQTEWVELFNPNSQPVTLTNWKIVDAGNHVRTFTLSLPAQKYVSVAIDPAVLNNTGDQILLQSPDGLTVDQFQYASCTSGLSWSLIDGDWTQTEPTQNQLNESLLLETHTYSLSSEETLSATTGRNSVASKKLFRSTTPSQPTFAKEWLKRYQWSILPATSSTEQTNTTELPSLPPSTLPPTGRPEDQHAEPHQQTPPFPFSSPAYKPILYASTLFHTLLAISQLPAAWRWYTEFREQQRIRADPFGLG